MRLSVLDTYIFFPNYFSNRYVFLHFRQKNASEPTHLRFKKDEPQKAENVTVEGTCCWKICSTQDNCSQLMEEGQNMELKIEDIFKIDVISCQVLTGSIASNGVKGEFIFFGSFMFVSFCCLFAIVFFLA